MINKYIPTLNIMIIKAQLLEKKWKWMNFYIPKSTQTPWTWCEAKADTHTQNYNTHDSISVIIKMEDSNPYSWRTGLATLGGSKDTSGGTMHSLFFAISSTYMDVIHQGKGICLNPFDKGWLSWMTV